jgi:ATP-dependent protease ClpP protease subunit
VQGLIDQQLVNSLTPDIISLQHQSRDPITVYINSPGGNIAHMEMLLRLLAASNQDFANPCRLITVVTSRAASAAADILSSGDYALAYPDSTVLYHGVRMQGDGYITAEVSSLLAQHLRANNDSYAMELARRIEFRFMFRFITSKQEFEDGTQGKSRRRRYERLGVFLCIAL